MYTDLKSKIKDNGLIVSNDIIPKYVVCSNCGIEKPLHIWLNEHGKKCKLPKLDINRMT